MRTRTLAAEVMGSIPWRNTSQSPPSVSPKTTARLQCWVTSGQTTDREGTQPHPSADKWIKVLLSSAHQSNSQLYPPQIAPIRKLAQVSSIASSTRGQTAEARRTTILQHVEQKPHSQIDKMKRQRAMYQMKEQDKTPEQQLNEVEIGNHPEKEFREMIVKMIQNLGNRMEKIKETFNKDLEELKSKQTMINNTINEIKNSLEGSIAE